MNRPTLPLRLAGRPTRHRRARRRPVALVFRRPSRPDPAAPRPTIRAGDRVVVTLAPRFTVVLRQFLAAAAVVDRSERPGADGRRGAPGNTGRAARSLVVRDHGARAVPWPGWRTALVVQRTTIAQLLSGQATTAPWSPVDPPPARSGATTSVPSPLGGRPRPAAGRRSSTLPAPAPSRPGPAYTGEFPPRRRRSGLGLTEHRHPRRETLELPARGWAGTRDVGGPPAPAGRRAMPRVELALGTPARQEQRHVPRAAPVATVYRQQPSSPVAAPARPPTPALDASLVRPTIDIDHLDRELWRRFEKRARTERERRGRA